MKKSLFFVMFTCFIASAQSQHLFPSEHSTPAGRAELNSFLVHCLDDCYFTMFLRVKNMDFESSAESGAMYRVWNESRDKFILFGIDANKQSKGPQITLVASGASDKVIIGSSKLGAFEGFRFKWKSGTYWLANLRSAAKDGYSQIEESGLSHTGKLNFVPHSIEYLFLGVDVTQYVDATSQNINPEWKSIVQGN